MRVAASSAAWVTAAFTFVAIGLGFLMLVLPIPHDVALWLVVVFFMLAAISGYGAWAAHYRAAHPAASTPPAAIRGTALDLDAPPTIDGAIGNVTEFVGQRSGDDEARYWSTRQAMDMFREDIKRM